MTFVAWQCLERMLAIFRTIDTGFKVSNLPQRYEENILGYNAGNYLQVLPGQKGRERLEMFYSIHRIPQPLWLSKLDRLHSARVS